MNNKGFNSLRLILIIFAVLLTSTSSWLIYDNYHQLLDIRALSKANLELQAQIQQAKSLKVSPKPVIPTVSTPSTVTILYNNYGFDPNSLNITLGTVVYVKNTASDGPMVFDELPHQVNPNPELNLGIIPMGQEKSFKVTVKGTWQFQNGNEASDRGILTVT